MKKVVTVILVSLLAVGIILVGVGLILSKGDFSALFEQDVRTEKHIDETETVTAFSIDIASDDIELYPSEDGLLHIDYWDSERRPFVYSYSGGTAKLEQPNDYKSWFSWGINAGKTIKVYVPATVTTTFSVKVASGSVEDKGCMLNVSHLSLKLSSGDVKFLQTTATTVDIDMSSGNASLEGFTSDNISVNLSSGNFTLKDSQISGLLDADLSSGNVSIKDSAVRTLRSDISSGNLTASNLITDSVNASASSGNITLYLAGSSADYSCDIDLSSGNALIQGEGVNLSVHSDIQYGTGAKHIDCETSSGDIKIYFEN